MKNTSNKTCVLFCVPILLSLLLATGCGSREPEKTVTTKKTPKPRTTLLRNLKFNKDSSARFLSSKKGRELIKPVRDGLPTFTVESLPSGQFKYRVPGIIPQVPGMETVSTTGGNQYKEVPVMKGTKEYYDNAFKHYLEHIEKLVPGCLSTQLDLDRMLLTVVTEEEVKDWAPIFDQSAHRGGILPYWEEMLARGRRSSGYAPGLFKAVFQKQLEFPGDMPGVYEVSVEKGGHLKILLYSSTPDDSFLVHYKLTRTAEGFTPAGKGVKKRVKWEDLDFEKESHWRKAVHGVTRGGKNHTLKLTKVVADCDCHDRYALRLVDPEDKCLWKYREKIIAPVFLMARDLDGDGNSEILLITQGHEPVRVTILNSNYS